MSNKKNHQGKQGQASKKKPVVKNASEPLIPGSNIKDAPVVHTSKSSGEIYIPEPGQTEDQPKENDGRFIKTAGTPHVATPGTKEEPETQTVSAERYTDRFTSRAPGKKEHTGYTGKINTYAATHSALKPEGSIGGSSHPTNAPVQESVSEPLPAAGEDTRAFAFSGSVEEFLQSAQQTEAPQNPPEPESKKQNKSAPKNTPAEPTRRVTLSEDALILQGMNDQTEDAARQELPIPEPESEEVTVADFSDESSKHKGNADKMKGATRAVDIKGSLLRRIAGSAEVGVRKNPDRMMVNEESESIPEEEDSRLDSELSKNRAKRFSAFRFWNKPSKTEEVPDEKFTVEEKPKKDIPGFFGQLEERFSGLETPFAEIQSEEFTDASQRKEVFDALSESRKKAFARMLILAGLGVVLLLIDLITAGNAKNDPNGLFTLFGSSAAVFTAVNVIFLISGTVIMFRELKNGLFSLLKMHPKTDTALLFAYLGAFLQTVAAFFTQGKLASEFQLFAPVVLLLSVPYLLAEVFYLDSIRCGFKTASAKNDISYLRRVSDEQLVKELLREKNPEEHTVVYAGKTRFVKNYIQKSIDAANSSMPSSRVAIVSLGVSVLCGLLSLLLTHSLLGGITAMIAGLVFSFPVAGILACGKLLKKENDDLSVKSAYILSQKDAEELSSVDNIVLSADRIFSVSVPTCYTDQKVSRKQAEFVAGVVAGAFTGPLAAAFQKQAADMAESFPACEEPIYEERLGYSAWVSGCKVLLGTHALLRNHSVEMPEEAAVLSTLSEGEKPVYLALEGKFAAVFGVKYSCQKKIANDLRGLVENGANLLLDSDDALLTDELAEALLKMPSGSIRSVAPAAAQKLNVTREAISEGEEAGIGFADSEESMSKCLASAVRIRAGASLISKINEAASYAGLAVTLLLTVTKVVSGATLLLPLAVQIVWCVLCLYLPHVFIKSKQEPKEEVPFEIAKPEESKEEPAVSEATEETLSESAEDEVLTEEPAPEPKAAGASIEYQKQEFVPPVEEDIEVTDELLDRFAEDGTVPVQEKKRTPQGADSSKKTSQNGTKAAPEKKQRDEESILDDDEDDDDDDYGLGDIIVDLIEKLIKRKKAFSAKKQSNAKNQKKTVSKAGGDPAQTQKTQGGKRPVSSKNDIKRETAGTRASEPDAEAQRRKAEKSAQRQAEAAENKRRLQAADEERTRKSFTPPPMPEAPIFDLSQKAAPPDPLQARFEPPTDYDPTSYFTDADFSRFEDDKVFSPLNEERKKRR